MAELRERSSPSQPEAGGYPEKRVHGPASTVEVLAFKLMRWFGGDLINNIGSISGQNIAHLLDNVTLAGFLFPKEQHVPKGITDMTHFYSPDQISPLSHLQLKSSENARTEAKLNQIMYKHIASLAGYTQDAIKRTLATATLNLSNLLGFGIDMKYGSFFKQLFLLEARLAAEKPEKHGKDTITGAAGVYELFSKIPTPESKDQESLINAPYEHAILSLMAGATQYVQDMSTHGGYYYGAEKDPQNNPVDIQNGAHQLAQVINAPDGWQSLFPNNLLATKFDEVKKSKEFQQLLNGASRCANTPNLEIVKNGKTDRENPFRFTAKETILTPDKNGLTQILVRVFNKAHTHYMDTTITDPRILVTNSLRNLVNTTPAQLAQGWKAIEQLEQDQTRPVFAISITDKASTPQGLLDNFGCLGKSLVHLDFRVGQGEDTDLITHYSHVRLDGAHAVDYKKMIDRATHAIPTDNQPFVMERTPLYKVDKMENHHDLLTSLGFSNIVVGERFNTAELTSALEPINQAVDGGLSDKIVDYIKLNLHDNQQIEQIFQKLETDYPEISTRVKGLNQATKTVPLPANEIEAITDALFLIQRDNVKISQQLDILKSHKSGTFSTFPRAIRQSTNIEEIIQYLAKKSVRDESLTSVLNELKKIKSSDEYKITQTTINKTANLLRDLFSPRISPVHLFDYVMATRGGVVNCTLPLAAHERLNTAMVKGNEKAAQFISTFQALKTPTEKQRFVKAKENQGMLTQIMTDLGISLDDQTKSRLNLGTAGFFLKKAGGAADKIAALAQVFTPQIVRFSRYTYAQTSFLPGLGTFISALSADMPEQAVSVGLTDNGKGAGFITFLVNLAKPESKDLYLNMLRPIQAFEHFIDTQSPTSSGHAKTRIKVGRTALAAIRHLKITDEEKSNGITLIQKLKTLSQQDLSEDTREGIKELMVQAIQYDVEMTIEKTTALAEMLSLYTQQVTT